MDSQLKKAVIKDEPEKIEKCLAELKENDDFSLASLIDQFLDLMLMECSLRYGSFHFIKMSLFLRELSLKNYFSRQAELEIARVVVLNLSERHFIKVKADAGGYKEAEVNQKTFDKMEEEIKKGNAHNAFYYALGLLEKEPQKLKEYLINMGMERIPDSLGHSISCFFPVMRDIVSHSSNISATATLSNIMYFCRYDYQNKYNTADQLGKKPSAEKLENLALKAVSGKGIENLHHMITLYTFLMLEESSFYQQTPPYSILEEFIGDKKIDQKRMTLAEKNESSTEIAANYQQFKANFPLANYENKLNFLFDNLNANYKASVSYLHRLYAENYDSSWNPHYYTSLYCALGLYKSEKINNKPAARMAVIQALEYFVNNQID